MRKMRTGLILSPAVLLFVLCYVWPAIAAGWELLTPTAWEDAGLSLRRLTLTLRGIYIAIAAAVLAQLFGALLAAGFLDKRASVTRAAAVWVAFSVLLTPPYIYAYGWSLPLLPEGLISADTLASPLNRWLTTTGRAVWCLATWTAPLAAMLLTVGWRTHGRRAINLALLDAAAPRAFLRAALPIMAPWLWLSIAVTGLLALTEFSVCHLCMVQTLNTEILAQMQILATPGRGLAVAWPLVLLIAASATLLWRVRRREIREFVDAIGRLDDSPGSPVSRARRLSRSAAWLGIGILLLPWMLFARYLHNPAAFVRTWAVYPREWPDGMLCAGGAALIAVVLAVAVDYLLTRETRADGPWTPGGLFARFTLIAAALGALAPPALVGDAFLAAFTHIPVVSDHWPVVSLLTAARFSLIAILTVRLAGAAAGPQLAEMAAADGATFGQAYLRVRLPVIRRAMIAGGLAVALLAFTEVAATQMVRPPGVASLSITLLNAIHYGRNDEVVAMCFYLMGFVGIVVVTAQLILYAHYARTHRVSPGTLG